jgi:dolichol-phosphate mannosyltransferase
VVDISVVIPVFNNAAELPRLYERLVSCLEKLNLDFQIVMVDDQSGDLSGDVICKLAQHDPRVEVLQLPVNRGQNVAICKGMARSKGNKVVVMDADLQDRPEHLAQLLSAHQAPGEAVFLRRATRYQGRVRMLGSRVFKKFIQLITGLDASAGTYFVVDRKLVTMLVQNTEKAPVVTVLVALHASCIGYVDGARDFTASASNYSLPGLFSYAVRATRCAIRTRLQGARDTRLSQDHE